MLFYRKIVGGAKTLDVLIKGVGPLVAVLWIGWQYQQTRNDKRVEATLEYVKRFEADDSAIGKAQRALTEASWQHEDELADLQTTQASKEQLSAIRSEIAHRILDTAGKIGTSSISKPLDEMDAFFNALATCIEGSVCDERSAVRYFGCVVEGFSDLFEPVIKERRHLYQFSLISTCAPNLAVRWT